MGTPEDIYHRPASAFVADFVGTANRFPGRIESGADGVYSVAIDGVGTRGVPGPAGLTAGSEVLVVVRPENLAARRRTPASGGHGLVGDAWSTPRSSAPSARCG